MVFVYTAMGVLCVEHANVLELCYIELLSGDGSPYSILSDMITNICVFGRLMFGNLHFDTNRWQMCRIVSVV